MAILWRQLFDAARVPWIDRGHNTSKGHVNVRCPWCGEADPSYHLGINEADGAYYCLRSTSKEHSGRSPYRLLNGLKIPPYQIDALLRDYSDGSAPVRTEHYHDNAEWAQFDSAADHPFAVNYLRSRKLDPPAIIARRYDMRFTTTNQRNAWRILLPLRLNFEIIGWTGRTIGHQTPRYQHNDPSGGASLYIPVYPTRETKVIIIVEGPFDAIAISDAYYPTHEVTAIAVTGLNINLRRRQQLIDVIGLAKAPRVLLTLDSDQKTHVFMNFKNVLVSGPGIPHPESFPLPIHFKDAGEMMRGEIRTWLNKLPGLSEGTSDGRARF